MYKNLNHHSVDGDMKKNWNLLQYFQQSMQNVSNIDKDRLKKSAIFYVTISENKLIFIHSCIIICDSLWY